MSKIRSTGRVRFLHQKWLRVVFAVFAIFIVFCVSSQKTVTEAHDGQDHDVTITMYDNYFEPKNVEIEVGATLTFVNKGQESHWPASDIHPTHAILPEFDSRQGVAPGDSYSYVFERPGTWRYHDHLFPEIVGKILVIGGEKEQSKSLCLCLLEDLVGFVGNVLGSSNEDISNIAEDEDIFNNQELIGPYLTRYGVKAAVTNIREQTGSDGLCHNLAHVIGREAYVMFGAENVFSLDVPECLSGVIHGATEGFFADNGTSNLSEDVNVICEAGTNRFDLHQCHHGIGHGLMAWTAYEIHEALSLCDLLLGVESQESCYSGVFMENVVGGLSGVTGHTTQYLSDDPHMPCNVVEDKYVNPCYAYQSSRMIQLEAKKAEFSFKGPFRDCSEAVGPDTQENVDICFWSMGRDVHAFSPDEPDRIYGICVDHDYGVAASRACVEGAAGMTVWDYSQVHTGVEFCNEVLDPSLKGSCYDVLIERIPHLTDDLREVESFCSSLDLTYSNKCIAQTS